ncbi:uncharacterized protein isoform X2 [Rhodnius prolixus]|uniref:Uncharacterized protein n=2 Tax=Rhodnius prolixus TaxID=13249 RepID=A0A905QWQ9_RHOPR
MQGVSQEATNSESSKSVSCRSKRKARWKLKFHHQALPAEYLDHYEASLSRPTSPGPTTVRYTDLPYMGEMTLDNARPRRGRKPKKADICHLIYKNYGTTVVDEPLNLCIRDHLQARSLPPCSSPATTAVPTHNVSMCKFKFTGGPTPSLKEKKVLSVDAGGAFRYYDQNQREQARKKSRKSLAREKLEQTFKEKGFLIQTQQLESAQGATYCKFRQLRKFTRYLFRSWKHHLPGEIVSENLTE